MAEVREEWPYIQYILLFTLYSMTLDLQSNKSHVVKAHKSQLLFKGILIH
uniref:Uncharacterized protein n=1 Tax=Anguilla anguilla TaxID=7936 RepID=A0A0E9QZ08_ANGAN